MKILKDILQLKRMGFHVFPIKENSKKPLVNSFTEVAKQDFEKIKHYWHDTVLSLSHPNNVGIATTNFGQKGHLVVVDIDYNEKKNGFETLLKLELEGFEFPKTLTQKTPSGGQHLIYRANKPYKQGVNVLGEGIDIRSKGGYIVAPGSIIDGKSYSFDPTQGEDISPCPQWLLDKLKQNELKDRETKQLEVAKDISLDAAIKRAKSYLEKADPAIQGAGGDQTTFKVAARLKDIGIDQVTCLQLMSGDWNERCQPPWDLDELEAKIENAYSYSENSIGIDAPENEFTVIEEKKEEKKLDPIDELNKTFAFMVLGGKSTIIYDKGSEVDYISVGAFHDELKSQRIHFGNKSESLSHHWFSSDRRRSYKNIDFLPELPVPKDTYNLWTGYTVKELDKNETPTLEMQEGVNMFHEHLLENICQNDKALAKWFFGYMAHMIQKPFEKPLTALVLKGQKGIGKSLLLTEVVGKMFTRHLSVASDKKRLLTNFNKHHSTTLLFVLEEAFWSGDKHAEGILKELITGKTQMIEQKGKEVYTVKNLMRICIVSNEDWVVPATNDERRFAVFNVGSKRQNDKPWFRKMLNLLHKHGGIRLLMRQLKNFDLKTIDVDEAPITQGLIDQKLQSLNNVHAYFYACLLEGELINVEHSNGIWPNSINKKDWHMAFIHYCRKRHMTSWLPDSTQFTTQVEKVLGPLKYKLSENESVRERHVVLPPLKESRSLFDKYIRHKLTWPQDGIETPNFDIFD